MIRVKHRGNFDNTEKFFDSVADKSYLDILKVYAERGVNALRAATPAKSGGAATAWKYTIEEKPKGRITIAFINNKQNKGCNIVLLLIYGHATGNGGYVEGEDFVTPALRPVFRDLAEAMWKEVTA